VPRARQEVGDPSLAGLRIDADDGLVAPPDVLRVDRKVGDLPDDGVLVAARGGDRDPVAFYFLPAPPAGMTAPYIVTADVYRRAIIAGRAGRNIDLVIVDTQVSNDTDESGLFDQVYLPMLHDDAWAERARATTWLPEDDVECAAWSQAVMELGALVCMAGSPPCRACPIREHCRWVADGSPAWDGPTRSVQPWTGTDRQCRGRIMASLRATAQGVLPHDLVWHDPVQLDRCIASLVADGLAHRVGEGIKLG